MRPEYFPPPEISSFPPDFINAARSAWDGRATGLYSEGSCARFMKRITMGSPVVTPSAMPPSIMGSSASCRGVAKACAAAERRRSSCRSASISTGSPLGKPSITKPTHSA